MEERLVHLAYGGGIVKMALSIYQVCSVVDYIAYLWQMGFGGGFARIGSGGGMSLFWIS